MVCSQNQTNKHVIARPREPTIQKCTRRIFVAQDGMLQETMNWKALVDTAKGGRR